MRIAAIVIALAVSDPAYACHRFTVWNYPYPQPCDQARGSHSWYVEIVPPTNGERTPEQTRDAVEHDQAVAEHKDELNAKLKQLKEEEAKP